MTKHRSPDQRSEILKPCQVFTYERKYWLCDGLRRGTVTHAAVMQAHGLSDEELNRWLDVYNCGGLTGLKHLNRTKRRAA